MSKLLLLFLDRSTCLENLVQKFSTLNDLTILFGAVFWNQNKIENTCGRVLPVGLCMEAGRLRDRSVNSIFGFCIHILFLLLKYYQSHKKIIIILVEFFHEKSRMLGQKSQKSRNLSMSYAFMNHDASFLMCKLQILFLLQQYLCFLDF